ncbi:MAG: glycoside hydrolase family 43 protein [Clostridiales bacterium]|nr:glycoside hydrolase family 43 protein [Clostridiales bacterium]
MIHNPIIPGFNPDPCICRKGDNFYLAVSTFEWMPGIPVYHSRDLKHWELYTHVLTDDEAVDLKKLPSAKGIWAPCLTYCEADDLFYVVYGVMNSMNARYFDVDNFLVTAKDIRGPWSEPVYLHSAGFDASLFHDDDGRKYVVSLDWETRENYEKPGAICLAEYDPVKKEIIGYPQRMWWGGTDRGCIEAPHLTKHGKYYYIMCAEGGTGYNHCVTMGRSTRVGGPYVKDPKNPIVTSIPGYSYERDDPDHLKPKYFNPDSVLQKSGHGSYVDLPNGETYLVHLCARPFVPELRCTLGRETAIQKMKWTDDGWLRMADGSNLAKAEVEEPGLPDAPVPAPISFDDFDASVLQPFYYAPRIMPQRFVDLTSRPGWVRLRGQESRASLNKVSLLARKLTSVYARVTTKMEFSPDVHQHSAGLILYYDNMDYSYLRKYRSDSLDQEALAVIHMENGTRTVWLDERVPVEEGRPVYLRVYVEGRKSWFEWSYDGENYQKIGGVFDTTKLSDEYCKYGEFTGTMVGITCADLMFHKKTADFDFFEYVADETRGVE